jgi:hypothetical protein
MANRKAISALFFVFHSLLRAYDLILFVLVACASFSFSVLCQVASVPFAAFCVPAPAAFPTVFALLGVVCAFFLALVQFLSALSFVDLVPLPGFAHFIFLSEYNNLKDSPSSFRRITFLSFLGIHQCNQTNHTNICKKQRR